MGNSYKVLVGKPVKRRHQLGNNIRIYLMELGWEIVD
jgi:hypothetical protein